MAIPPFLLELRSLVGTRPLWLSAVSAVVLDDQGRVLLARRVDDGRWASVGGILDPGEQPADGVVRECLEETGVEVVPELLASATVTPPVTYSNGDVTQYLVLTFRCRAVGGEARVNDDESLEVGWFALDELPPMIDSEHVRLRHALECQGPAVFTLEGRERP
ncbi:NUDIX hydrolase [Streptomyces sp. CBMA123]|uniref:NUDIX hydrolase n=1 Tax=Streptomyces sp. CBMA123 TaxID=1896313 RepID=UPI0016619722|nr:NUDIX domain-containing protein [Streptomyces sp. CBMA123]MBD0690123.1 NUDIX hydrolase [Streptomyces sp. CBMA123]